MEHWNVGLVRHLGIRFVEVGKDRVVAELPVREELMTLGGTIHGGTLMAFADPIGAAGTNFFAGCRSGTVRAESTPLHKGKRTHVWQTRLTDEAGKLLSLTVQTQMIL